jgi:3'(2'), 5'-bisphosphate nucleotidase
VNSAHDLPANSDLDDIGDAATSSWSGGTASETMAITFDPATAADLFDKLTALVSHAGAAILAVPRDDLASRLKTDNSPVTRADEAAEALIVAGLSRLLPDIAIVSEESADRPCSLTAASFALVDPLDGTKEFIAGRGEYTVNVALVTHGAPLLGIVAAPALGLIWRGIVGRGAERLSLRPGAPPEDATECVAIHPRPCPARGATATVSRSHFDPRSQAFLARLPEVEEIVCGSAVKFCRLAEGAADVYPRFAPTMEWDDAAGHAVLAAAGGLVTQPDGSRLTYGHAENGFRVPGFIAWGDPAAAARYVR